MNACLRSERIPVHVNLPVPLDGSQLDTRSESQFRALLSKSGLITKPRVWEEI